MPGLTSHQETDLGALREWMDRLLDAVAAGQKGERMICALAAAAHGLLTQDEVTAATSQALELLGQATDIERIAVYRRGETQAHPPATYHRERLWSREVDDSSITMHEVLANLGPPADAWEATLLRGELVVVRTSQVEGPMRDRLEGRKIGALLVAPIVVEWELWGFVLLACKAEQVWTRSEGAVLSLLGASLGAALERRARLERRIELERRALAAEKLESLALLAGGIAHDVNNLLGVVRLSAHALHRDSFDKEELTRDLDEALATIVQLNRRLVDYLGGEGQERELVDVLAVVKETARLVRSQLGDDVVLDVEDLESVPSVMADAMRVKQAVMNMVINASHAIGNSGVIRLRCGVRDLSATDLDAVHAAPDARPGPHVWFSVADDGDGVPKQARERILDPFFTTKDDGSGLGLTVVTGLTRSHHGALQLQTAVGVGTTFTVYLPMPEPDDG